MIARVKKGSLNGSIDVIISKSYAHRIMICSSLAQENTKIIGNSAAKDVMATRECLIALGAEFKDIDNSTYMVKPLWENIKNNAILNAYESGSTLRFLLPVAAALGCNATFNAEGRLNLRPMGELTNCLRENGLIVNDNMPLKIEGGLHSGDFTIRGDISSQYISGLLFALPLLDRDSTIIIQGELASVGYIDITIEVLNKYGITIDRTDYGFFIRGNQTYKTPCVISVNGDWSNAAFFLVAGAISGSVKVLNLDINSQEKDKQIIEILRKMGAEIIIDKEGVTVHKSTLSAVDIDASDIPDLVPILSVAASLAEGTTRIYNVERLRLKESDRIESVLAMLKNMGIKCSYQDCLVIYGGRIQGGVIDGCNDHRIVMSAAIAALKSEGDIIIQGAQAVDKSYPDFFNKYNILGGNADVVEG